MPEENENQIQLRSAGGIGRQSELARRGMNAANYVSGLAARQETDLQQTTIRTEYTYEFLHKWGTEGAEDGQFSYPHGLAIDGDGDVYVSDRSNHRVQVFDPQGRFLRKWGAEGTGDGEFAFPERLAIDRDGDVYVADTFNDRIQVFQRVLLDG